MKNFVARMLSVPAAGMIVVQSGSVVAATLTAVPMQGGMVMPMVSYHSGDGRMQVMMPADIPQLTPLLVSNPADGFDPADPWFEWLDPSGQGASFSRRYGFVMDGMSNPLPPGMQMWIRKRSGPAELKFYRYSSTEPKAFEPIFGTDGVTNALFWGGTMFHPVVAAPPGTNAYTAEFEVYLLDTATGQEVSNSSSGALTFDWTNVPDGRPVLKMLANIGVAWPVTTSTNWVLESADSIAAAAWTAVTNTPAVSNDYSCVILETSAGQQFFRMRYIP